MHDFGGHSNDARRAYANPLAQILISGANDYVRQLRTREQVSDAKNQTQRRVIEVLRFIDVEPTTADKERL